MRIALAVVFTGASMLACASRNRDSATGNETEHRVETTEVGYEHVARRPHAVVALAESRGLDRAEAAGAIEGVADRLETCTRDLAAGGSGGISGGGVVRVVARVADDGTVDGLNVKVEPGHAPTALRCVIAPVKLLVFRSPSPAGGRPDGSAARGFALEAQWTP